jgi:hypothetical protein
MLRIVSGLLAFAAAYLILLAAPYPLFAYHASYQNITVYSDQPLPPEITPIIEDAEARIAKSPLNDPTLEHRIFICSTSARFAFFANYNYRVGGITYTWLNRNIFLRPANIKDNRLIGYSGREVPGERTLAYFFAHEIGHSLEENYLGRIGYSRFPTWKQEGYADVVAKAGDFDFDKELAAFRANSPELDPLKSGLYLRYHLLCAWLLDRKHVTPQTLLESPFDGPSLERELSR